MNKNVSKKHIKEKVYAKAFDELKIMQSKHSKVKDIKYEKYTCQENNILPYRNWSGLNWYILSSPYIIIVIRILDAIKLAYYLWCLVAVTVF